MNLELREGCYNNVVTIVLYLPIVFVFFMCLMDLRRSRLFFNTFFTNKYFYAYPVDVTPVFSLYYIVVLGFLIIAKTMLVMLLGYSQEIIYGSFVRVFIQVLGSVFGYCLLKILAGKLLSYFFKRITVYKQMLVLETSYLACVLLLLYPVLSYGFLHLSTVSHVFNVVLISALLLYCFRFVILVWNNKNLVSGQLLYIILYLCILEIVPFIYLFKRYTE